MQNHKREEDPAIFEEKVAEFREKLAANPEDDYAWHYLAFNLQRLGHQNVEEIENAYKKAASIKTDHPWYYSRLITFLIALGKYDEAESLFDVAIENCLDPDHDKWSPKQLDLHRWVSRSWLLVGKLDKAWKIYESAPDRLLSHSSLDRNPALRIWHTDMEEAEERDTYGSTFYPRTIPLHKRWKYPTTSKHSIGFHYIAWYPAEVRKITDEEVTVLYAMPKDRPDERRVQEYTFSRKRWDSLKGTTGDVREGCFIEIFQGGKLGQMAVFKIGDPPPPRKDDVVLGLMMGPYLKK